MLRPPDDATWQFATLRDPDIQKIMDKFELEDHRPHVLSPGDVLVQACFKCCGLKVHNNELFFVKMIDGVIIEPEMPSNQFKQLANKTMKSEAGDRAVRNLLARVERKLGSEKSAGSACRVGDTSKRPCIKGVRLGVAIVQHGAVL